MIPTLKAQNGVVAKLGNPQTQTTSNSMSSVIANQTSPSSPSSIGTTPVSQVAVPTISISLDGGNMSVSKSLSLSSIANNLSTQSAFLLPPFHSNFNNVLPSYAIRLKQVQVSDAHVSDEFAVTSKKFEPYEQVTGISHERPELIMLMDFLPLYSNDTGDAQPHAMSMVEQTGIDPFMTDAGRFFDAQVQVRNLRHSNTINMMKSLRERYPTIAGTLSERRGNFGQGIEALKDSTDYLLDLIRNLNRLKSQLDLRDDIHTVDPSAVAQSFVSNFSEVKTSVTSHPMLNAIKRYLPPTYTVPEALTRLGYDVTNVRNTFASTKIWLQLLFELREMLKTHSLEFIDADPVVQRNDKNASVITKSNVTRFNIRNLDNLSSLKTLVTTQPSKSADALKSIKQAFNLLYENVNFKTEETRLAALAQLVSREFRYSFGLAHTDVQNALNDGYAYKVVPADNVLVFDSVVGKFGNNISDFPAVDMSLASVAQNQPAQNVAVLTFESKYVEGDTGTLTPGSVFYVDQVLQADGTKFDTTRMTDLSEQLDNAQNQFNVIVNGMNLLSQRVVDQNNNANNSYEGILTDPSSFADDALRQVLDSSGNTLPGIKDDALGSVFTLASKDPDIKALLFLMTMCHVSRAYQPTASPLNVKLIADNTPLYDALTEQLLSSISKSVLQTQANNQYLKDRLVNSETTTVITEPSLRAALKHGSVITRFIESTLGKVLNTFRFNQNLTLFVNDRSRFGGHLDTTLMMAVFDMLIGLVTKYGNQRFVASHFGATKKSAGEFSYTISKASVNNKNSRSDIINRLNKEASLAQSLIFVVTNTLQKLAGSLRNYVNYLSSPPVVAKLSEIFSVIDDIDMFRLLLSEQQVMMLGSTVYDLVDRAKITVVSPTDASSQRADIETSDDEIKILDESAFTPALKNVLLGFMKGKEFAWKLGNNKKVLSVGIPLGFSQRLKQKLNVGALKKSTFVNKQSDVVKVAVYKVDLENSDIVYKPRRFLFELSRFPVRNEERYLPLSLTPTLDDVVAAVPTRDFSQDTSNSDHVTYWPNATGDIPSGFKLSFDDESYSFLLPEEKRELSQNHVTSYLLELYVQLMTGINLADYHFDIVESPRSTENDFVKLIVEHRIHQLANNVRFASLTAPELHPAVGGVLFTTTATRQTTVMAQSTTPQNVSQVNQLASNVSRVTQFNAVSTSSPVSKPIPQQSVGNIDTNLSVVTARSATAALHDLRTISGLASMVTSISDPLAISKRILQPKQFDRVFNVVVDPDDFEVDYDATVATPFGKQALEQMLIRGDISAVSENEIAPLRAPGTRVFPQARAAPNVHQYKHRDRDKNEGDLVFEKYFVVVETFDEDGN